MRNPRSPRAAVGRPWNPRLPHDCGISGSPTPSRRRPPTTVTPRCSTWPTVGSPRRIVRHGTPPPTPRRWHNS
eukprot:3427748-Lingulodinium_polyedra.AAC.1